VDGADGVTITGVSFRDAKRTFLERHGVPSGGDWSLFKGAAVTVANSRDSVVEACTFSRLDGSAVMLTDRTRNVQLRNNEFEVCMYVLGHLYKKRVVVLRGEQCSCYM